MVLRYAHLALDQLARAAELVVQKGHTPLQSKRRNRTQLFDSVSGERGTRTLDLGTKRAHAKSDEGSNSHITF